MLVLKTYSPPTADPCTVCYKATGDLIEISFGCNVMFLDFRIFDPTLFVRLFLD